MEQTDGALLRRRLRRLGGAAAAAFGIAVGAAVLAGAQTAPTTSGAAASTDAAPQQQLTTAPPHGTGSQAAAVPEFDGRGPRHKPQRGGPGRPGGPHGAIHGEFVAPGPDGGWQTIATQTGVVTAVSSSSITVKSADGFEKAYVVDEGTSVNAGRDGIADVKKDETVHLIAVVKDRTARAVQIHDTTALDANRRAWAPQKQQKQQQPAA